MANRFAQTYLNTNKKDDEEDQFLPSQQAREDLKDEIKPTAKQNRFAEYYGVTPDTFKPSTPEPQQEEETVVETPEEQPFFDRVKETSKNVFNTIKNGLVGQNQTVEQNLETGEVTKPEYVNTPEDQYPLFVGAITEQEMEAKQKVADINDEMARLAVELKENPIDRYSIYKSANGDITPEFLQSQREATDEQVKKLLEVKEQYEKETGQSAETSPVYQELKGQLTAQQKKNLMYELAIQREIYEDYVDASEKFLGEVDAREGFLKSFWGKIKDPRNNIPFARDAEGARDFFGTKRALEKYQAGEELSDLEQAYLFNARKLWIESQLDTGVATQAGDMAGGMPKFAFEMAMTGGLYKLGKKGVYKVAGDTGEELLKREVAKELGQQVSKRTLKQMAVEVTASSVGAMVQTSAFVPTIANKTAEYMLPEYDIVAGENGDNVIKVLGGGDEFEKALRKAYLSTYVELATERSGVILEDSQSLIMKSVLGKFAEKRGIKTLASFNKIAEKIGWNGIIGEVFEEELGELAQAPIEERDYYAPFLTEQGTERLLVETLGISAFAGISQTPFKASDIFARRKVEGDTIDFSEKDDGGSMSESEQQGEFISQVEQEVRGQLEQEGINPDSITPLPDVIANELNRNQAEKQEVPVDEIVQHSTRDGEKRPQPQDFVAVEDYADMAFGASPSTKVGFIDAKEVIPRDLDSLDRAKVEEIKQLVLDGVKIEPIDIVVNEEGGLETTEGTHRTVAFEELGIPVPAVLRSDNVDLEGFDTIENIYNRAIANPSQTEGFSDLGEQQRQARGKTDQGKILQEIEDLANAPATAEGRARLVELRKQLPKEQKPQADVVLRYYGFTPESGKNASDFEVGEQIEDVFNGDVFEVGKTDRSGLISLKNTETGETKKINALNNPRFKSLNEPTTLEGYEEQMRETYRNNEEAVYEAMAQIFAELDIAEAGKRIAVDDGQVIGIKSTFPSWIPEELRSKDLINKLLTDLVDINSLSYPKGNRSRQRALYDAILDEIDSRADVDTSQARIGIMDSYEKEQEEQTKKPVRKGTKRTQRRETQKVRDAVGIDYSLENGVIEEYGTTDNPDAGAFITSDGEFINGGLTRLVDHREMVSEVTEAGGTAGLIEYMAKTANIRIVSAKGDEANIDLVYYPNTSQIDALEELTANKSVIYADVSNPDGSVKASGEFDNFDDYLEWLADNAPDVPYSLREEGDAIARRSVAEILRENPEAEIKDLVSAPYALKFKRDGFVNMPKEITSSKDVAWAFRELKNNAVESLHIVGVKDGSPVYTELVSIGTINEAMVSGLEVTPLIFNKDVDGVWMVHNHPSGDPTPSQADILLTKKMDDAMFSADKKLYGHVVINTNKYGSVEGGRGVVLDLPEELQSGETKVPRFRKFLEWTKSAPNEVSITGAKDVIDILKGISTNYQDDVSVVFFMDTRNRVIGVEEINMETKAKDLANMAVTNRAVNIIVVNPSDAIATNADGVSSILRDFNVSLLDVIETYQSTAQDADSKDYYVSYKSAGRLRDETPTPEGKFPDIQSENREEGTEITDNLNNALFPNESYDELLGKRIKPIQFPELVQLARELNGSTPQVKAKMGNALGRFKGLMGIELRADIFENPSDASKVLAHEIGHLVDWLPDANLSRGNLVGRLNSLSKYMKQTFGESQFKDKQIREELKALTKEWHPFDETKVSPTYLKYRYSGKELYADALSVMFNDPALLKEKAPKFFNDFFGGFATKPQVRSAFLDAWDMLNLGEEALNKARRERVQAMFNKGEDLYRAKILEANKENKDLVYRLKYELIDKNQEVIKKIKELEKKGVHIPAEDNPEYFLESNNYIGGLLKAEMDTNVVPVYENLQKAGIDWNTFGEVMFHERVINERGQFANPLGFTPDTSQKQLDLIQNDVGVEKWNTITENLQTFRNWIQSTLDKARDKGLYTAELVEELKANPAYATFQVLDYMDTYITPNVVQQVGTLKEVGNPASATVIKTLSTLRAVEKNETKNKVISTWERYFPNEIKEADYRFNGRTRVPVESRNKDEALLRLYQNGKLRGYYVDPYLEASTRSVGQGNAITEVMSAMNSVYFRPVFTTLNLGFQTFNFKRDFTRFWKNVPNMTLPRAVLRYAQAVKPSYRRAVGITDELITEMESKKIIGVTYNDVARGATEEHRQMELIIEKSVGKDFEQRKRSYNPIKAILSAIETSGNFIESLPKVAGYIELNGKMPDPELASYIRTRVGSPDWLRKGASYSWYNNFFLFSNAIKEGIRSDISVATDPKTRGGWWAKTIMAEFIPKLIMKAVLLGFAGDELKKLLEDVSEYDKTNYTIIPLGRNGKETIYLRIPSDETGRLLGGVFWKVINVIGNEQTLGRDAQDLLSFTGGQIPTVHPIMSLVGDTWQYMTGNNPYDNFRGRNVLTDDEFRAGTKYSLKPFLMYQFQNLGGNLVFRNSITYQAPESKNWIQKVIDAPVASNIIGRWIKSSNYGQYELNRKVTSELEREASIERLEEQKLVREYLPRYSSAKTDEEKKQIEKEMVRKWLGDPPYNDEEKREARDLAKKLNISSIRGESDPLVNSVISQRSNSAKALILNENREQMDEKQFDELIRFMLKNKVISEDVLKKMKELNAKNN